MKKFFLPFALAVSLFGFNSCKKDKDNSATLDIRMTDAPTALQEVNVDIRSVRVKFADDPNDSTKNWVDFTTQAGVYNLLTLQNGVNVFLANGTLPERRVKEIRFVLGPNNTVKDNNVVYPLTIPSGAESGLKIKFSKDLNATGNTVLVDFDAALSVSNPSSGVYTLRPVLKIK